MFMQRQAQGRRTTCAPLSPRGARDDGFRLDAIPTRAPPDASNGGVQHHRVVTRAAEQ